MTQSTITALRLAAAAHGDSATGVKVQATKHQPHCRAPQGFVCCCIDDSTVTEEHLVSTTADPASIHIISMKDGGWNWDVSYFCDVKGFGQDGKAKTLDEAMRHVRAVIKNGRTTP